MTVGEFTLRPGDTYGAYGITGVLGRGSFAGVYEVNAEGFEKPMALKVSHQPVGSDEHAQRALREISIMASLTNPHVVRLHDSGLGPDGRVFLLMDRLEGLALDQAHSMSQAMPTGRAVQLVHQACLGLAEAHAHQIVHRDLKPENLWIRPDGSVVVLDFGLARSWNHTTAAGAPATVGHMLIGTPHYTQPEQIQGGKLTPASDVYSLATILYELLCGHSPLFEGLTVHEAREHLRDDAIGWLKAHCLNPPVRITSQPGGAGLPEPLAKLLQQSLDKDPDKRPQHAGILANELGEILHHDLGSVMAGLVRITHPYGGHEDRRLLPGSHRIGAGPECELRLRSVNAEGVLGVIEWTGGKGLPLLRPNPPVSPKGRATAGESANQDIGLSVDGAVTIRPRTVEVGAMIEVAGYKIEVRALPGR